MKQQCVGRLRNWRCSLSVTSRTSSRRWQERKNLRTTASSWRHLLPTAAPPSRWPTRRFRGTSLWVYLPWLHLSLRGVWGCLFVLTVCQSGQQVMLASDFYWQEHHFCLISSGLKHKACADRMKNTVWKCESQMLFYMFQMLNVPPQVYYVLYVCIADLI